MIPLEVELIIYRYLHEINMSEVRREIIKNIKTSLIYELKWKGIYYNESNENNENNENLKDEIYDQEYDKIMSDKNISSLYFRSKLEKVLLNYY